MKRVSTVLSLFLVLFVSPYAGFANTDQPSTVSVSESLLVTKVYGSEAKVRRVTGTLKLLVVGDRIQMGDLIQTDARSWVEVLLGDGSLVRVAPNSEYRFEKMELAPGHRTFQWAFGLAKGGIRAIVEKSDNKQHDIKFKVRTPAAIMGVRGTELVLRHNPETNVSELYTLSGKVLFGALDTTFKNPESYRTVGKNTSSMIHQGDANATVPKSFTKEDILNLVTNSAEKERRSEVVSLFFSPEIKGADTGVRDDVSEFDTRKLLKDLAVASAQFAEAQNYLSGYERLENEKVAAVSEGLMRQGKMPISSGAEVKEQQKKVLSSEQAKELINKRLQKYTEELKTEKNIYLSKSTPDDFSDTIKKLEEQIQSAKQNAKVAASCGNKQICDSGVLGSGIWKSCHTAYVCEGQLAKPTENFPVATEMAENLNNAIPTDATADASNDTEESRVKVILADPKGKALITQRCCKAWVSCEELRHSKNACTTEKHGRVVEVCGSRCPMPGAGTSFGR